MVGSVDVVFVVGWLGFRVQGCSGSRGCRGLDPGTEPCGIPQGGFATCGFLPKIRVAGRIHIPNSKEH